jgi:hypothetical protein
MVRLIDFSKRHGGAGIQRQLSLFFKAPYHTEGEEAEHNLFNQATLLQTWIDEHSKQGNGVRKLREPRAAAV